MNDHLKKEKIKVLLSTGIGSLHLMKSAQYIDEKTDLEAVQGWVPKNTNSILVKVLSVLSSHKHLSKGLNKRKPLGFRGKIISLPIPEFYFWGGLLMLKILGVPSRKKIAGKAWKLFGKQTRKYLKGNQIFHVRSGAGQGGAISEAKERNIKVVVDHSIAHPKFMEALLKEEYEMHGMPFNFGMDNPLFRYTIEDAKEADIILVNSDFVKDTFLEEGFAEEKVKVIYLGVREDFFQLKSNYKITDRLNILFTGSFGYRKGGYYLFEAMKKLEELNVEYKLNIIGNYQEGKDLINKIPLKNVEFHGFIPQDSLKSHLKNSDMYVFPSLAEGCASSGMEALASGLPVISTVESGLPIQNNHTGIIVPPKNSESIVDAILKLKNDYDLRYSIGVNAIELIRRNYKWSDYSKNLESLYFSLLNKA